MYPRSKHIVLVVSLFLLPFTSVSIADDFIRISSFNIAEFGEGSRPSTRKIDKIAEMLVNENLDLVAIQEVGIGTGGASQVNKLTQAMNDASSGTTYFSWVSPLTGDECYAVIYRSPVIMDDEISWLDDDKVPANPSKGGKTFFRVPVAISFHAGNFDFVIVIMHLTWGKLDRRFDEMVAIRESLVTEDTEGDWIFLGDMNRYGKYKETCPHRGFDQLTKDEWKSKYRFPLLEAITEPDDMNTWKASADAKSTTVSAGKNIYDQFIITAGAFTEFGSDNPVLGTHVGIVAFDMELPFSSITDHNELKFQVSDHRPIWARFRIDLPDDD